MIKFIFNFIFFGVLFYAIWLFFPDAFKTLTDWAGNIYNVLIDLGTAVVDYVSELTKPTPHQPQAQDGEATTSLLLIR